MFVSSEEIDEHGQALSDRLSSGRTIPGEHSHHKFVPTSDGLKMFRFSADKLCTIISREKAVCEISNSDLKPGEYVAVMYDLNCT